MTKLLAHGWIRPQHPIVIVPHGTAAEIVNAALDFAPLSGVWVCFCGHEHEEYEVVATHVIEAHVNDPNFDKWIAEGARSVAGQHNPLVWAFADELLFEDEKRPGYIGPDRTDIVGL